MRDNKRCPKCDSLQVGHLRRQVERGGEQDRTIPRPLGEKADQDFPFWASNSISVSMGHLEAYICTDCGFYETYVVDPSTVEWDKLKGFALLNPKPESSGPFR